MWECEYFQAEDVLYNQHSNGQGQPWQARCYSKCDNDRRGYVTWKALFWKVRVYNNSLFWRSCCVCFFHLPGMETSFCSSVFSLVISLQSWMSSILRGKQTNYEERLFTGTQVMQVKLKDFKNMDFISWLQSNFLSNDTQTSVWNCMGLSNIITLKSVTLLAEITAPRCPLWMNHTWRYQISFQCPTLMQISGHTHKCLCVCGLRFQWYWSMKRKMTVTKIHTLSSWFHKSLLQYSGCHRSV